MLGPNSITSASSFTASKTKAGFAAALLCGTLASGVVAAATYFGGMALVADLVADPVRTDRNSQSPLAVRFEEPPRQTSGPETAMPSKPALKPAPETPASETPASEKKDAPAAKDDNTRFKIEAAKRKAAQIALARSQNSGTQNGGIQNSGTEAPKAPIQPAIASTTGPNSQPEPALIPGEDDIGLMIAGLDARGDVADLLSALEQAPPPALQPAPSAATTAPALQPLSEDEDRKQQTAETQISELDQLVASLNVNQPLQQAVDRTPGAGLSDSLTPSSGRLTPSSDRLSQGGLQVSSAPGAGSVLWNGRFPSLAQTGGLGQILTQDGLPLPNPKAAKLSALAPGALASDALPKANTVPVLKAEDGSTKPRSFILSNTPQGEPGGQQAAGQADAQPVLSGPALTGIALEQAVTAYGISVSNRIRSAISYPKTLEPERVGGTVELGLILNETGQLIKVMVFNSSQNRILDESAIATVRGIRFPVPPSGATSEQLRFGIKMVYTPPALPDTAEAAPATSG